MQAKNRSEVDREKARRKQPIWIPESSKFIETHRINVYLLDQETLSWWCATEYLDDVETLQKWNHRRYIKRNSLLEEQVLG